MFEMMTGNCCLLVYLIFFTAFTYEQQSTMDSTTMTTATDVKLLDEDGKTDPGGATYSVGEENSSPETTINENQSTTSDSDAAKTEDSQDTMIDAGTKTSTSKEDETSTPKLVTTVNELGDSDNQGSTTTSRPTDAKSTQTISEDEMSTSKLMTTLADDDRTTLTTSSQAEMEMMSKPVNSVEMSSTTVSMIPSVSTPLIESTPRILNVEIPPIQPESVFPFIPAPPSEDSAASLEQKPTDDRHYATGLILDSGTQKAATTTTTAKPSALPHKGKGNDDNNGASHLILPSSVVTLMTIVCVNIVVRFNHHCHF